MAIFSDADLDDFADLAEDLALKDSCEILSETSSSDDGQGGEENITWSTTATVPCMVTDAGQAQPTETVVAARLDGKTLQIIWFKRGVAVTPTNRLQVSGQGYHILDVSTDTYEVLKPVWVWREQ